MSGKIVVFGAGNVGGAVTRRLVERKLCKTVVLVDRTPGRARGVTLDIREASPIDLLEPVAIEGDDLTRLTGAELVIITAGSPRKPGMSRDDLLKINAAIVRGCVTTAMDHCPEAFFLVVTNPLNAMCQVAMQAGNLKPERIAGMAGILDAARFQYFIARELAVSPENVQAMVLGEHGDDMVCVPRYSTVAGIPVTELLSPERLAKLVERTKNGGAEIVNMLSTSAYYAPASAVVQMVASVVMDKKKILPCAAWLRGQYGIDGMFVGVPVKLGRGGVEQIMELSLNPEESAALRRSADKIGKLLNRLDDHV